MLACTFCSARWWIWASVRSYSLPAGHSLVCPSVKPGEVLLCKSRGCQGTLPSTVRRPPPTTSSLASPLPPSLLPPPPHSCLLSCVHWPSSHSSEHVLFIWLSLSTHVHTQDAAGTLAHSTRLQIQPGPNKICTVICVHICNTWYLAFFPSF